MCHRCGFLGALRDLRRHCKKKKICDPKIEDIELDIDESIRRHNKENLADAKFVCENCEKKFKSKYGYQKHIKGACKVRSINSHNSSDVSNNDSDHANAISGDENNLNAIDGNENNLNSNNVSITINNYGHEDVKYLVDDKLLCEYCASRGVSAHSYMYNNLYFNKEHPENQTIKESDTNRSYLKIFKNGKFVNVGGSLILDDVIDKVIRILKTSVKKHSIPDPQYFHFESNTTPDEDKLLPVKDPTRDERRSVKQNIKAMIDEGPTEPSYPDEVLQKKKNLDIQEELDKEIQKLCKKLWEYVDEKFPPNDAPVDEAIARDYIKNNFMEDMKMKRTKRNLYCLQQATDKLYPRLEEA